MAYAANPDGRRRRAVVDFEGAPQGSKQASMLPADRAAERDSTRAGAADLDATVEDTDGLSWQARRDARATPPDVSEPPPDPRMRRRLPSPLQVREPLSGRQKDARSKVKRTAQSKLTKTEHDATDELITSSARWGEDNAALAAAVGDVQQLPDEQMGRVQRVDRAIQKFQRAGDRGDVVYVNLRPPRGVNSSNVEGFLKNRLPPGTQLHFDRFTAGALNMHEVEAGADPVTDPVLELQTTRAAYLGRSRRVDDSAVLLPRGMSGVTVVGHHWANYDRPDGSVGRRLVVQAIDPQSTGNQ